MLEKMKPIHWKEKSFKTSPESEENNSAIEATGSESTNKRSHDDELPENQRKRCRKEDTYVFFNENEEVWLNIKNFYNISDNFDPKCLLRRNIGKRKNIYLTSPAIRDLVLQNQNTIKFINTGLKTFVRRDNKYIKECAFGIANEGLKSIFDCIGVDHKISIPREDLITLLLNATSHEALQFSSLSEEVQVQVKDLTPGSCILIYNEEIPGKEPLVLHISAWKGTLTLGPYMPQHSAVHYLRLLDGDTSKYDIKKFKKPVKKEGTKEESETN